MEKAGHINRNFDLTNRCQILKASIYAFDAENFQGLMLIGEMTVCTDRESRERLWREGDEMYYPAGIDDPDYCVLKFEARRGNYYHGLHNETFDI